jgi:hypothetical protein
MSTLKIQTSRILNAAGVEFGEKENRFIEIAFMFECKKSIHEEMESFLNNVGKYDFTENPEGSKSLIISKFEETTKAVNYFLVTPSNDNDKFNVFDLSKFIEYQLGR